MIRHRFEAYLDKVFGFSDLVNSLPEGREFPQHPWKKIFDAVFLSAAMQIPSLLQIEAECRDGVLAKRIGPISDDTIGYALDRQSPEPVFALSCEIARRLKRNGVLHSEWSRGLVVAAVDGIEICSSFVRCCDACMEREIQHKVNGEMRTDIQYYHRIAVIAVVSTPFPIPLGLRFQKNGEGEVACALALLRDLDHQLGRRFLDVLVGDALYMQAPFVKEVERLGLVWAFTVKENQPELLREAERFTQEAPTGVHVEPGREIRYWHLPEIDWPVADRLVRVVKTVRIENRRRVTVTEEDGHRIKSRTAAPQESTNLLRHQFRSRLDLAFVHSSAQSESLANRYGSVSNHHQRLPPQTSRSSPDHGPGPVDHDPVSCLYAFAGFLPPPGLQPCSRKMRDLSGVRQKNRRLVCCPCRQYQLILLLCGREVSCQKPSASVSKRRRSCISSDT